MLAPLASEEQGNGFLAFPSALGKGGTLISAKVIIGKLTRILGEERNGGEAVAGNFFLDVHFSLQKSLVWYRGEEAVS